jgi:hypothetical protein
MRARRIILAILITSLLLTTACLRDVANSLTEVRKVYEALTREFGETVLVNINQEPNHMALNVSFINSALNSRSSNERAARAQRTAEIVKQTYTRINKLDAIWVGFVRQETHYVLFHRSELIDYFWFSKDGTRFTSSSDQPDVTDPGAQVGVAVSYSRATRQSDVLVNGIYLQDEPDGVVIKVVPHYTVSGDVRAARVQRPEMVAFDFTVYADMPNVRQSVPITFFADKKPVLLLSADFHGNSCPLLVPYDAFSKMIAARALTIRVAGKDYPLRPEEFAAIQRMGEYVK